MKKVKLLVARGEIIFEQEVNRFLSRHEGSRVIGYSSSLSPATNVRYEELIYSALIEY